MSWGSRWILAGVDMEGEVVVVVGGFEGSEDSKMEDGARSPRWTSGGGLRAVFLPLRKSAARGSSGGGCLLRRKKLKMVRCGWYEG